MVDLAKAKIVKRGICQYAEHKEYGVVIEESKIRYGTGDYEDPVNIANDMDGICYYIHFESLIYNGVFNASGGCFTSLDDAIRYVERFCCLDHWVK